jgi:mono/diheme cytochrome c family protein
VNDRARACLGVLSVVAIVLLAGCGSPPAEKPAEAVKPAATPAVDVKPHMGEHFTKAADVQAAVVRGDLDAAKEHAKWLAEHEEIAGLPASGLAAVQEMKRAAKAVVEAPDAKAAAQASAEMAGACGTCHAAANAKPSFPPAPAKAAANPVAAHMHQHQHAIDLLYHGLIAPSGEAWAEGAKALKTAPLTKAEMPKSKSAKEAAIAEAETHAAADKASAAQDPQARADVYGQLVAGCASCHALHGMVLGEGMPKK